LTALTTEQIQAVLEGRPLSIDVEGTNVDLNEEKVIVERLEKDGLKVLNEGTLTVGLDSKVTDELKKEGYVRDLIRGIQNQRKENGYNVTDRITISLSGDDVLQSAFNMFSDFISNETLATSIKWETTLNNAVSIEADDKVWSFVIAKA